METMLTFAVPAGSSHEYTLPIPEEVDEISYLLRSASYAINLRMSMMVKGVGTKTVLKLGAYNCHEECIVGKYNIKEHFFGAETSETGTEGVQTVEGERKLTIFVDNLNAWMYGLKIFFEIRDASTGKMIR